MGDKTLHQAIEIVETVEAFVETWEDLAQSLPFDYGCVLTCSEAETLAGLFRALGKAAVATEIVRSHAEFDEPGDAHYEQ